MAGGIAEKDFDRGHAGPFKGTMPPKGGKVLDERRKGSFGRRMRVFVLVWSALPPSSKCGLDQTRWYIAEGNLVPFPLCRWTVSGIVALNGMW